MGGTLATMETGMKALLLVVALVAALSLSCGASAQQSGTADDAKALLAKAATAVISFCPIDLFVTSIFLSFDSSIAFIS